MDVITNRSRELLESDLTDDRITQYLLKCDPVPAPEIPADLEWVNSEPLSIQGDLHGRYVLLDFFTYCCINCMHILPALHRLEEEAAGEEEGRSPLVVVGIHSGKFSNEKDNTNILRAVERYGISHPVVNDASYTVWNSYQVICWPTLVLINPEGKVILVSIGESQVEAVCRFVLAAIRLYPPPSAAETCQYSDKPTPADTVAPSSNKPFLRYPGKVHYDVGSSTIFVADTGNRRVIQTNTDGQVLREFSGSLSTPHGLTTYTNKSGRRDLIVCDTARHRVLVFDLEGEGGDERVLCGITDRQGHDLEGGKQGEEQELASPWDVVVVSLDHLPGCSGDMLVICAAGTHQIWACALTDTTLTHRGKEVTREKGVTWRLAGNGEEANRNNSYANKASFAQPSGITFDGGRSLYVADSESSTVRVLDIPSFGVKNVVGGAIDSTDLFCYGDTDGKGTSARLQHPIGVEWCGGAEQLIIADSYNHKLKCIKSRVSTTIQTGLSEPSGLSLDPYGRLLYIADTNSHTLRRLALGESSCGVVDVKQARMPVRPCGVSFIRTEAASLIELSVDSAHGRELNKTESHVTVTCYGGVRWSGTTADFSLAEVSDLGFTVTEERGAVDLDFKVISCSSDGMCHVDRRRHRINIGPSLGDGEPPSIRLTLP